MLRTILVGLDGSEYGWAAAEYAIGLARRSEALVVGLAVIDEPDIRGGEAVPLGAAAFKEQMEERKMHHARVHVEQILEQFSLRCAEQQVPSKVLEDVGLPAERILRQAERYDLVVLGQQTYFAFETQDEPDDTLEKVLRGGVRPVVVVPRVAVAAGPTVVAYDGSAPAARTLQLFQLLGMPGDGVVHVVTVQDQHADAVRCSERAVDFLGGHGVACEAHAVGSGASPGEVVLQQIAQYRAGLLVAGAYGHSALRELFFGSTTRGLLAKSPVPLFMSH